MNTEIKNIEFVSLYDAKKSIDMAVKGMCAEPVWTKIDKNLPDYKFLLQLKGDLAPEALTDKERHELQANK